MQPEAGAPVRPPRALQPKQQAKAGKRVETPVEQPPGSATKSAAKRLMPDPRLSARDAVRVTIGDHKEPDAFEHKMAAAMDGLPERTEDILKSVMADPERLKMMATFALFLKGGAKLDDALKAATPQAEKLRGDDMDMDPEGSREEEPQKSDASDHETAPSTEHEEILKRQAKLTADLNQKTLLQATVAYHADLAGEHARKSRVSVVDEAVFLQFVGQPPATPKPNARITVVPPEKFRADDAGSRNGRRFIADVLLYAHESSQDAQAQLAKLVAPELREPMEARRDEVSVEGGQWGFKEAAEFFLELVGDDLIDRKRIALAQLVAGEPRQNNKPLFQYIIECRTLFARAGYTNVSEELACEFFLRGLQRELQSRCLTQPDGRRWDCLNDLYQYARGQDLAIHARGASKSTAAAVTPLAKQPEPATAAAFTHPPRNSQGRTKGYGNKVGGRGAGGHGGGAGHSGGGGTDRYGAEKRKREEEEKNRSRETRTTYNGGQPAHNGSRPHHNSGGGRGSGSGHRKH